MQEHKLQEHNQKTLLPTTKAWGLGGQPFNLLFSIKLYMHLLRLTAWGLCNPDFFQLKASEWKSSVISWSLKLVFIWRNLLFCPLKGHLSFLTEPPGKEKHQIFLVFIWDFFFFSLFKLKQQIQTSVENSAQYWLTAVGKSSEKTTKVYL